MTVSNDEDHFGRIAVVGMAGRFPGAGSVDELWDNLVSGVESIRVFTDAELAEEGISSDLIRDPSYVKARGLVEAPEAFDAAFFGIRRREAELMDPQHRLFLETCWHALENAGHPPADVPSRVGVWGGMSTGMSNDTYLHSNLGGPRGVPEADRLGAMLGNENDYLTTRVSYKLDLRGPSVSVQTACSTSLVAIVQAFQSLLTWECDVALAGGVSVSYPQRAGYVRQEGGIGSPDGHCRPFDAEAQGTVFSNGVGVVVLKRLEDALEDGDRVMAVIRGAASNNDGASKVSFAAPSVTGQAEVIASALAVGDVDPSSITYVEAHGTGTPIGDPIEVEGLTRAFRRGTDETGFCAIGSIKSNFGHLDSAAGVAGFIKTVLSLHHRTLVPTLHFSTPSPKIDWNSTPFYVSAETRPWDTDRLPRRAGVSAFGIGGTNAHVILEEAPARSSTPERAGPHLLPVSARTPDALDAARRNLAGHLGEHDDVPLADVAGTLQVGRSEFRHRLAVVASGRNGGRADLESGDPTRLVRGDAGSGIDGCVFLFPGGGAQYVGMGRGLLARHPTFRDEIDQGIELLLGREGVDVRPVWFADDGDDAAAEAFQKPSVQLPALFILEMAIARLLIRWGFEPTALIGHSLGENTAACLAGVLSYEDALGLVALRGRLFDTATRGGMLSVAASPEAVRARLGSALDLAAINAPEQCTVSGPREPLEALAEELELAGIDARMVPIDIAAHSAAVEPLLEPFRAYLESIRLHAPKIPFLSNRTGTWITDAEATDPAYWVGHLRDTVRFADNVRTVLDEGRSFFFEAGPGRILSSLVQLGDPAVGARVAATMRHPRADADDAEVLLGAVGRAWVAGADVDWSRIHGGAPFRRVALPGYPFERRPFIIQPEGAGAGQESPSSIESARSSETGSGDPLARALELQARTNAAILTLLGGGGDADDATEAKPEPEAEPEPEARPDQQFEAEPDLDAVPAPTDPESEGPDRAEAGAVGDDVDLVSWLCENWGTWADRTAVVGEDRRLSYAELERRSNRLAHHLTALGLGPGNLVGICLDRSADMLVATIAVWKAGLGYVPLDPTHPSARLNLITQRADLAALITDSAHATLVWSPIDHRIQLDRDRTAIEARPAERPEIEAGSGATAYVLFTSGSTGEPKGVRVPRRAVMHFLRATTVRPGLRETDVVLSTTTLAFDISVLELFLPLRVGAKVVVATSEQTRDGDALSEMIDRHEVTTLQFTPTGWRVLKDTDWRGRCRMAISGGETLPRDVLRWLLPRADEVWNAYGPTEATVWATFAHLEDAEADIHIGRPLPGFQCYVLDSADQPCPTGVPGELCLAGPQVADEYVGREEETARSFVPNPFSTGRMYRTGDLVRWREDGTLDHMGRLDQQVKVRGYRIELGEIESVLSSRSDVRAAVVALVVIDGTPELAGYVVPADTSWDERSIRGELATHLPDYMIPRFLVRLDEIPLTANGKTDRAALPDPRSLVGSGSDKPGGPAEPSGVAEPGRGAEPTSEAESFLIELWQEILEVPHISVDDNFFDLGGHSLLAVRMIGRVEREWGADVPLRAVMAGSLGFIAREHLDTASANAPDDESSSRSSVSKLFESVRGWVSD